MEKDMSLNAEDEDEQDPTVQLWLYYFLSQHYLRDNKPEKALDYINKAIDHTPTVPDLYLHKAKIFYYVGNTQQAHKLVDEGRLLDTADRNINYYASKYMLRNNDVETAHEMMCLFSHEALKGEGLNVHEMQTMWFEYECAQAYYRRGDYRLALK